MKVAKNPDRIMTFFDPVNVKKLVASSSSYMSNNLAMNLGETYLVTENGNERLGKQKLDLVTL